LSSIGEFPVPLSLIVYGPCVYALLVARFRVMQALKSTDVPVPTTRLYCPDNEVLGTPFFVYDYVEGRFFKTPELSSVSQPADRTQLYKNMIETLAKVKSVDIRVIRSHQCYP
jgi:aminoglycoside phosphotransferase (APT) family kinase protein